MADMIKVEAIETGFYESRRRPGDVFEVPADLKLGKWMKKVSTSTPVVRTGPSSASLGEKPFKNEGKKKKKPAYAEPRTLSEMAKIKKETSREDEALA